MQFIGKHWLNEGSFNTTRLESDISNGQKLSGYDKLGGKRFPLKNMHSGCDDDGYSSARVSTCTLKIKHALKSFIQLVVVGKGLRAFKIKHAACGIRLRIMF